jgi:ABC-type Fe3+-siderophore transport system permease subunit
MISRRKQQLGGLFIAVIGGVLTGWTWYTALYNGYFNRRASLIFPAFLVIGLALIIFPGYKEERIARGEDVSRLQGAKLITRRWWVILIAALAAGGLNYLLLSFMR